MRKVMKFVEFLRRCVEMSSGTRSCRIFYLEAVLQMDCPLFWPDLASRSLLF
jgi:hypothetical protein